MGNFFSGPLSALETPVAICKHTQDKELSGTDSQAPSAHPLEPWLRPAPANEREEATVRRNAQCRPHFSFCSRPKPWAKCAQERRPTRISPRLCLAAAVTINHSHPHKKVSRPFLNEELSGGESSPEPEPLASDAQPRAVLNWDLIVRI